MKKIYNSPEIEILEISVESIMLTKSLETDGDDGGRGSDVDGIANEYRGDWENIWGNM